ncbi:class I SAM-dependent DNA methyltransferase [Mycobacterium sp. SMC-4]|uniref:HsdM family class I SAM-dependent methyltransferase n=1 Tax=Mycobacterium sp. SMC-4 TaxID=2857059 RepID=UPI0021B40F0C|nr:N-6 DNA methylase [Mycobacterium sp. SMC-4]UXA16746.1 N-6 DNA methylase [Mycobacterium sp. SMC-4]
MVTEGGDTAAQRKARGAFFTPESVARYVTEWAVRGTTDRILEPSCGEAAFLLAAVDRLAALRASEGRGQFAALDGIELHAASARAARTLLRSAGIRARVRVGDFFTVDPTGSYDVVIGNPPYIRYQDFSGTARARSRAAALRAGVGLTNLASSWAAFAVHSALFLKPGGRMGLVLPAELLSVNYAAEVRRFLLASFARVDLVLFTERLFPDAQEEVLLLLADGYRQGPTDHASIYQARNAAELATIAAGRTWTPVRPEEKWTPSLMSADALSAYTDLLSEGGFTVLESWGDTTLGMVTGNNKYFALSPARVADLGLESTDVLRLSPPGSRHLRGLAFGAAALNALGRSGSATWLFRPAGEPSPAAWAYIAAGEAAGVHTAYKCRVRTPWWRVPNLAPADLLLTYMNADTPRLSTNTARAAHLNSVHGVYLDAKLGKLGKALLPLASLTSMTLLGAETVGRAYGGGMLKLEPREADRLPVPPAALVQAAAERLTAIRPHVAALLRRGELLEASTLVDDVLLIGELGMARSAVGVLREAHAELRARRVARGRRGSD